MPIEPCGELLISAGELGYSGSNKSEGDIAALLEVIATDIIWRRHETGHLRQM
jgi:hypothetical protein